MRTPAADGSRALVDDGRGRRFDFAFIAGALSTLAFFIMSGFALVAIGHAQLERAAIVNRAPLQLHSDFNAVYLPPPEATPAAAATHFTKVLDVDDTATTAVEYSSTFEHAIAWCTARTANVPVYVVEADAEDTTAGHGPFCDGCVGGAHLLPLGVAHLRTSSGSSEVSCTFVEYLPKGAGLAQPSAGGGGLKQATADARYLMLDASNDPVTGALALGNALTVAGDTTLGDASGDTLTSNAATWTLANDTAVALSGGVNGINFDANTLSIDATNNRVGIGTAAPSHDLHVSRSANANVSQEIANANAGGAAQATIAASNGSRYFQAAMMGTGFSTNGLSMANRAQFGTGGGNSNGLLFFTDSGGSSGAAVSPMIFAVGAGTGVPTANEKLRITQTEVVVNDNSTATGAFRVETDTSSDAFVVNAAANTSSFNVPVAFSVGGAEKLGVAAGAVVVNDASGDVDFRVETDDHAGAFIVDGGSNRALFGVPLFGDILTQVPISDGNYAYVGGSVDTAPVSTDCDSDAERGRVILEYTNHLLYVCNGASRGWDVIALADSVLHLGAIANRLDELEQRAACEVR